VHLPSNPTTYAWSGGAALATDAVFPALTVSRQDYLENGHQACEEKYYL